MNSILKFPGGDISSSTARAARSIGGVLIVSGDAAERYRLTTDVRECGCDVFAVDSLEAAVKMVNESTIDVCLLGTIDGFDMTRELVTRLSTKAVIPQMICLIGENSHGFSREILPAATVEYLQKPYTIQHLGTILFFATQRTRLLNETRRLKRQLSNRTLREMVGLSRPMQQLRQSVQEAAECDTPVMIVGEAGCGHDLTAQAIHDSGPRAHRPFVKVDCSVYSAESLGRELCGVIQRDAGNESRISGRFELTSGGTLFLDNFDQVALPMQKRLVEALQSGSYIPDEGSTPCRIDARIVVATRGDVPDLVRKRLFREDLFQMVSQNRIPLPTLRERIEDISLLAEHLLRRQAAREGKPNRTLTVEALQLLQSYHWPGNVRELENVLNRACSLEWSDRLTGGMIEPWLAVNSTEEEPDGEIGLTLRDMERKLIETTFVRFAGNREKTAKALNIGIRTLSGKLREYGYPPRGGPGSNLKEQHRRAA